MGEAYPPSLIIDFAHPFATDLNPQMRKMNHFTRLENIIPEADNTLRKAGGSTRINSTAITGTPNIMGMFDYWRAGTSGSFTQKFMAFTADSKIYKEDMDGTFDDITGGATLTADAVPVFSVFDDILIITDSAGDTPLSWNQTGNVASLAGSPPAGRGSVEHVNRAWMWAPDANPSRIHYSAYGDPETWTGSDTGFLDIATDDGDRIVGAVSYKGNLIVFKGPNKGSIHPIIGRTPGDFERDPHIVKGIALQTHNSIIPVADDVWYMSRRGIHSLKATFAQGNYAEADLSRYQHKFFRDQVSLTTTNLPRVWGANYANKSCALWTLTQAGQTDPAIAFGISYIDPEHLRPFIWTSRSCFSAATRINPTTGIEEIIFGTTNGFCERQDMATRTLANNSSIPMVVETPQIIIAAEAPRGDQMVNMEWAYLKSQPLGDWDVTLKIQRDSQAAEAYTFNQGSAGFILGTSVLGTGILGGNFAQTAKVKLVGQCRSAKFTLEQNGIGQDANLYELGIDWSPAANTAVAS